LEAAGVDGVEGLLALDAEMRAVRPIHGLSVDGALCAVEAGGQANLRFLQRLSISHSLELRRMLGFWTRTDPAGPDSYRLRIIARLGEDGSLEHGVELAGGRQILPTERFLREDIPTGSWQVSGDVEVAGDSIGRIRARRVAGGRTEFGFIGTDGETIFPDIRYLPADPPVGVWFRSSEIEVPVATSMAPAPSAEE
ncbi:MAG: hypothetical protein OXH89_08190, partial [bacterium]|nr:hypothetical protein [bacterium]